MSADGRRPTSEITIAWCQLCVIGESETNMRTITIHPIASCCFALPSGNVDAAALGTLTREVYGYAAR
jgi:hypothetical protein